MSNLPPAPYYFNPSYYSWLESILCLEDTFLEKPKGGRGCQTDPPAV